ncbi:efflux transporter outer membrane subunit [Flavobacteriaceae bacterium F08102]|nr:efflux transporter outer membrane subunit [Flavobacteriaceae bacterium F08102]
MKFIQYPFVIFMALLLSSCFVAKDYTRPILEETNHLYRDVSTTDSTSVADISWDQLFTDPYLKGYIKEGLENNLDIRVAIQQIAAAEAYLKQGKAGYLPTLNAKATLTHQELSAHSQFGSFLSNRSTDQYDLSANLSWEADIWGKIRSSKRSFQAKYLQSISAHQLVKTNLISSIATTYYRLVALDAKLGVINTTIENRAKSIEIIKALKESGQVTQVAVDQYIAQYKNAQALKVDLETEIFTVENTMSILLGKGPQAIKRSILDNQVIPRQVAVGYPATLLSNRPDVMSAEYELISAFELTNVARSEFYPSLTLTASGGFQSLEIDQWINANSLFANLIGGLTQPLFNQRKIRTKHEVALAQQEQALLNFKQKLLIAGKEVSDALYTQKAEAEKFNYRQAEVEALRNAELNSEILLNNGYLTYLDVLTARQSALNAELLVIESKLQQLLSVVNIYEALGGGWQ